MKKLKKLENLHIYFIGIGGISMSGLAKMCMSLGARVSGSDAGESVEIQELSELGVKINSNHKAINIINDIDIVVYTVAIKSDNPELMTAKALGIKCYERAEFLGLIADNYKNVIAVSGTHGKTTTTAMLGEIFVAAGLNPTIHIGGKSVNLKTNTLVGDKDYFILEACEYKNSFRFIKSKIALITNIELDHLDFYRDYNHLFKCFKKFAKQSHGIIIDRNIDLKHKNRFAINNEIEADNVTFKDFGYDFDVYLYDEFYDSFRINMLGLHNVTNALFAIATAIKCNIPKSIIKSALAHFKGVERRYELIGKQDNIPIIIDYAHHPSELRTSIAGIKQVYKNPLIIFQPHTYSRTLKLFDDFIWELKDVKKLYLYKTYPAREEEMLGGRAEDLAEELGVKCLHEESEILDLIKLSNSDIEAVVILGAGNVAERIKKHFQENV